MNQSVTAQSGNSYLHMWDVATMKQHDGGFLFDKTTIPAAITKLPKGVFLKGDFVERTAKLIKTAVVHEAIDTSATTLKLKKNPYLLATDIMGFGSKAVVIGTINTSNADYDTITIVANSLGALAAGDVLQTYDSAGASGKVAIAPDGLNPFESDIDAEPTCSIMFRADGVVTSRLPQAPSAAIKSALINVQFLAL